MGEKIQEEDIKRAGGKSTSPDTEGDFSRWSHVHGCCLKASQGLSEWQLEVRRMSTVVQSGMWMVGILVLALRRNLPHLTSRADLTVCVFVTYCHEILTKSNLRDEKKSPLPSSADYSPP